MSQPQHDMARDIGMAVAKVSPPITVYALTLNEWLAAVSILYVVLQVAHLVWRWTGEFRRRRAS